MIRSSPKSMHGFDREKGLSRQPALSLPLKIFAARNLTALLDIEIGVVRVPGRKEIRVRKSWTVFMFVLVVDSRYDGPTSARVRSGKKRVKC